MGVIHPQIQPKADNLPFAHVNQRRMDFEALAFNAGLGGKPGQIFKSVNKFGAAVGIALVVHRIDTDENVPSTQNLRPA